MVQVLLKFLIYIEIIYMCVCVYVTKIIVSYVSNFLLVNTHMEFFVLNVHFIGEIQFLTLSSFLLNDKTLPVLSTHIFSIQSAMIC